MSINSVALRRAAECRLHNLVRCAHEGHNRAVGGPAGVDIEQADTSHGFDFSSDLLDHGQVVPLA